jgi:putative DNA primase/helicase
VAVSAGDVRSELYCFLSTVSRTIRAKGSKEVKVVGFDPNKKIVDDIMDSLPAVCKLPRDVLFPFWLGDEEDRPENMEYLVACRNGYLDVRKMKLFESDSRFLNIGYMPVEFNPDLEEPKVFKQFLQDLWGDDPESVQTLLEFFFYCFIPDNRFQKSLFLIGPRRSGKGTLAGILTNILGPVNITGPSPNDLGEKFGLSGLVNKKVAIVSESKFDPSKAGRATIENLLRIIGGDTVAVNFKYVPQPFNTIIPIKFIFMSNHIPVFDDTSGALAGRLLTLRMTNSFYGSEDITLSSQLAAETDQIFNYILKKGAGFLKRRSFIQPSSSIFLKDEIEEIGSPVVGFSNDLLEFVTPVLNKKVWTPQITAKRLFELYRPWAVRTGSWPPLSKSKLVAELLNLFPKVKMVMSTGKEDGKREYSLIGLREVGSERKMRTNFDN